MSFWVITYQSFFIQSECDRTLPSSGGRQPDFERLHPDMVEHIQQVSISPT